MAVIIASSYCNVMEMFGFCLTNNWIEAEKKTQLFYDEQQIKKKAWKNAMWASIWERMKNQHWINQQNDDRKKVGLSRARSLLIEFLIFFFVNFFSLFNFGCRNSMRL